MPKKSTLWKFSPSSTATIRCKGGPDCCLTQNSAHFRNLPFTHYHIPQWEPKTTWSQIKRAFDILCLVPFWLCDFFLIHDYRIGDED